MSPTDIDPRILDALTEPAAVNLTLRTANGAISVDRVVSLQCKPLSEEIKPLLLDNTPTVLSVAGGVCSKAMVSTGDVFVPQ